MWNFEKRSWIPGETFNDLLCDVFLPLQITILDSVATNLRTYLLRTLCTNFANSVLSYISRTENVDTLAPKVVCLE